MCKLLDDGDIKADMSLSSRGSCSSGERWTMINQTDISDK